MSHDDASIDGIIWRNGPDLRADELHALLRLRVDVFVVEQACAYHELDGRDLEPSTRHGWIECSGVLVAAVRVLHDEEPPQIGRVVTAASHRGVGHAARLVEAAHLSVAGGESYLEAQSYLVDWYRGLGWSLAGEEFVEDGIPHVPMLRSSHTPEATST